MLRFLGGEAQVLKHIAAGPSHFNLHENFSYRFDRRRIISANRCLAKSMSCFAVFRVFF